MNEDKEVTDTNVGNIENLKTLLFQENLTQYGKRKLINYYEEKIKELKEQLEYDKTHIFTPITINLNYIPKQKIKDKIEEYTNKIEKYNEYKNQGKETDVEFYENITNTEIIRVLQELLQEEDK